MLSEFIQIMTVGLICGGSIAFAICGKTVVALCMWLFSTGFSAARAINT